MTTKTLLKFIAFISFSFLIMIYTSNRELEIRRLRDQVKNDSTTIQYYKDNYRKKRKVDF